MIIENKDNFRQNIFLFGLILLVIAIPTSKFVMSVSQLILGLNWLLDKRLIEKLKSFFTNKAALLFCSLYFIHVIWLINTTNFDYALLDLKIKLPIFALALIFSTTPPLKVKEFYLILLLHASTVLVCTFISLYIYINQTITDFRLISPYISHIRFGLNICLAFFTVNYFLFSNKKINISLRVVLLIVSLWFLLFLNVLQSVTSLFIIVIVVLFLSSYFLAKSKNSKIIKTAFMLIILSIPLAVILYLSNIFNAYNNKPKVDFTKLDSLTSNGNIYTNDTINFPVENGKWTGLLICESELQEAWNKRSSIKYNNNDKIGQKINITIIRYLTSKDLKKDANGINQLTNIDIINIENGIANFDYTKKFSIKPRINKLLWEYQSYKTTGIYKGHSLLQRFELWKTSTEIIKNKFLFGVGTGDVPDVFKEQLIKQDSQLKDSRMRSHNQFLSIFVAFGIFGLFIFIISLFIPYFILNKQFDYFCIVLLIIICISMLTEDTIESQDGVTIYAFFTTLYLFLKPNRFELKLNKN